MYVHCHCRGKRIDRSASPMAVSKAGLDEWRTIFCSRSIRWRRVMQWLGSRQASRVQWVEILEWEEFAC